MKMLLAGMHIVPNQFTRGIEGLGLELVHWSGHGKTHMATNCDAVVIVRCQIGQSEFRKAKHTYLELGKPIFVANRSFTEVSESIQSWLKDVGYLNDLGVRKKIIPAVPLKQKETVMSHAFQAAKPPEPKPEPLPPPIEEKPVPRPTVDNFVDIQPRVNQIIKDLHARQFSWQQIADELNNNNLYTKTGLPWTGATAPAYALKENLVGRRIATVAGPAGSTGAATPKHAPVRTPRQPKVSLQVKETFSETDVEEIMTSNLNTKLKLRVIKFMALNSEV